MTEDASDEAAWRDLVAHYATPAVADGVPAPWPTREDLTGPVTASQEAAGQDASGPDTADLDVTGLDTDRAGHRRPRRRPAARPTAGAAPWAVRRHAPRATADPHRPARQREPATG